jgi:hypothetical protein
VRSALSGHGERVKREQLMLLEISWHNARWSAFSEKLDSLGDVLRQAKGEEEDPEIAWHRMKAFAATYGQVVTET